MKIIPKFKVQIVNGNIDVEDKKNFSVYINGLENQKQNKHFKGFELTIKSISSIRGFDHNAFYWAVINPTIAKEMGASSRKEAHEELVWEMFPNGVKKQRTARDGTIYEWTERKPTNTMTVKEFTEFVEWVKDFGSLHFGIDWTQYIEEDEQGNITKKYDKEN